MSKVPKGGRGVVVVKFGAKNYYSRLKTGTIELLGLKALDDTAVGKNSAEVRGNMAKSHSYTLVLKQAASVGGVTVKTVAFPVDARVKKSVFRKWAKSNDKVAGMITPWGISDYWAAHPSRAKGGIVQNITDGLGNIIDGLGDQLGDAASNAAGQLGNAALDALVDKVTGGLIST